VSGRLRGAAGTARAVWHGSRHWRWRMNACGNRGLGPSHSSITGAADAHRWHWRYISLKVADNNLTRFDERVELVIATKVLLTNTGVAEVEVIAVKAFVSNTTDALRAPIAPCAMHDR